MSFFYLLTGPGEERELAALELWVLSGAEAELHVGEGPLGVDVGAAAYVRLCARTLAAGASEEELLAALAQAALELEGFRIEVYLPGEKPQRSRTDLARRVADTLHGRPNLDHPRVRLALFGKPGLWRLGEIVSESRRDWTRAPRAATYSAALKAQMARAMVNLVAAPGDRLLDPCCGLGTVVVQAMLRGIPVVGVEISKRLIGQTVNFVRQVQGRQLIVVGDARELGGSYEAAVIDLPYGRATTVRGGLYEELLGNVSGVAQRAVVLAKEPLGELLEATGWRVVRMARAHAGTLTRHVHLVASRRNPGAA